MKINYAQIALKDPAVRELIKDMILKKTWHHELILKQRAEFLEWNNYDDRDDFGKWFLEQVFDRLLEGSELQQVERDLSSMCFQLRRAEGKIPKRTKWEDQYEKATTRIEIAHVVQHYLKVDNFRRNVPCPFHEDKTPSMKVYTDSNRFVCFGCDSRGSPIDFVMQIENCPFREAVSILSNF